MLYQREKLLNKYIDLTVKAYEENSKRSSFERGEDGSLKFIYECLLYYMGGWVRMESDGCECEGRRERCTFQLFC